MPFFPVDDGFAFHRKAIKAGNAAIGLWTRAGSWSAQQLTDGYVPDDIAAVLGSPAQAKRLVTAGLWHAVEGGYRFHEWNDPGRNPTREKVLERRRTEADKKARARDAKSGKQQATARSPQGSPGSVPEGLPEGVRSTPPLPYTDTHLDTRAATTSTRENDEPDDQPAPGPGITGPRSVDAKHLVASVIPIELGSAVRTALAIETASLLREFDEPTIREALQLWASRTGIGPKVLPSLVADVVKSRNANEREHVRPPGRAHDGARSGMGGKARAWAELGERVQAEIDAGGGGLRLIEGGRSA
ncbi:MAG TPA: hypothetical protein VFV67_33970 [Actinophytocola sp.]|uniref:hypothetical protein n=1 Tax=Actinophytocola sp. TaxID=1872138 RepID=UPI002DB5C03A|nr:hypothetical protein [Actinophytocola sp.]HEU5475675.1 hypothetical protein [Actinophytocola sp.]